MNYLKLFFLNDDSISKNLIYETLPSHEVPAGGGEVHEKGQKNVVTEASEAFEAGRLKVPSWAEKPAPEAPLNKAEIRKREKHLEAYVNTHTIPLTGSERNDFLKEIKKINPNLDVNNENDKKLIEQHLYAYLDKVGYEDREKRLEAYVNDTMTVLGGDGRRNFLEELKKINPNLDVNNENDKKFIDQHFNVFLVKLESKDREKRLEQYVNKLPALTDNERRDLFAALTQIRPERDASETGDRKFIDQCYDEYLKRTEEGTRSITFLAVVTDVFQAHEALAAREKRRRTPR